MGFFYSTKKFILINFVLFFSCRLTFNIKSSSPAVHVLSASAQQEKLLHAAHSSIDEDKHGNEQMGTNVV